MRVLRSLFPQSAKTPIEWIGVVTSRILNPWSTNLLEESDSEQSVVIVLINELRWTRHDHVGNLLIISVPVVEHWPAITQWVRRREGKRGEGIQREKVIIFKNKLNEHFDKLNYFEQMIRTFPNWTCPKKKGQNKFRDHKMGMLLLDYTKPVYVYNKLV